jgi:hypothetical protein
MHTALAVEIIMHIHAIHMYVINIQHIMLAQDIQVTTVEQQIHITVIQHIPIALEFIIHLIITFAYRWE